MKIRAITNGQIIPYLRSNEILTEFMENHLAKIKLLNKSLTQSFDDINIEVQTTRLCSQPLFSYDDKVWMNRGLKDCLPLLEQQFFLIEDLLKKYEIDYFACCSMLADRLENFGPYERLLLSEIPTFIKKHDILFSSLPVASNKYGINLTALRSAANIIKKLSVPDPFNNLKFCVSSNVNPGLNTPFFPASYHFSEKPKFTIAMEIADEVVKVFDGAKSLNDAKIKLKARFNKIYENISSVAEKVAMQYQIEFGGVDLSPAPYPRHLKSIGTAVEKLGFEYFGAHGSLIAIALIRNAIPRNKDKVIGFSGFMQPVFEDSTLAQRLMEDRFNIETLLLYSTICGTGLDCIPLPGSITEKELFYLLLDICTISLTHNKPLTARLMPIPGKESGDEIEFDFEYFAPTKIIDIKRLEKDNPKDIFSSNEKSIDFN
ncbi:MAG: DUF711 family protein [Promethearchaeota archaeon]|nr:MAG: DUF711 family protein [Candidatus Lokiarchaeota archaeon]